MSKNFELSSAFNSSRGLGDGRRRVTLPQHPPVAKAPQAAAAGPGGYRLDSAGNSIDQAQARAEQAKVNEALVASRKEKEREVRKLFPGHKVTSYVFESDYRVYIWDSFVHRNN